MKFKSTHLEFLRHFAFLLYINIWTYSIVVLTSLQHALNDFKQDAAFDVVVVDQVDQVVGVVDELDDVTRCGAFLVETAPRFQPQAKCLILTHRKISTH